jgi:hypothetical protein
MGSTMSIRRWSASRSLECGYSQPPMDIGAATTAVLDVTCGNLIQVARRDEAV